MPLNLGHGVELTKTSSVLVLLWSSRLGGFLFFRVLKTGKDGRFDEMRVRLAFSTTEFLAHSSYYAVQVLQLHGILGLPSAALLRWSPTFAPLTPFRRSAAQLFWVWTVSLPLTILNSPNVSDPSLGGGNPSFGSARVRRPRPHLAFASGLTLLLSEGYRRYPDVCHRVRHRGRW